MTREVLPHSLPPHLLGLDRYEPGLQASEAPPAKGIGRPVKLASNENPLGPSPRAIEAVRNALPRLHLYPDGPAGVLRAEISSRLRVAPGEVVVGNGSTDLIDLLARAYLGPDENAVISEKAFARFGQVVRARNGHARLAPMQAFRHDLRGMAGMVDERTRLVYVANPNNPTGTWNSRKEISSLISALPPTALLVLDEAYFEYAGGEDDYPNGLDFVRQGARIVVLRTFSKVYGLAGLRIGYGIGPADVIEAIDTVREPFNSNLLGQVAGVEALKDQEHVARSVALNDSERPRLRAQLEERGLGVLDSLANFLCLDTGRDGSEVFQRLLRQGIIVRPLRAYDMPSWLRVTVGRSEENALFLEALDVALEGTSVGGVSSDV